MRVVIGVPVITECGGGQCRAAREAHVRQSDPSSRLIAPRLPRFGTAALGDSSTKLSSSAIARRGKAAAVPTRQHADDDEAASAPAISARGANHTRYTDIDQKQRPAADLFGVNGDPTGRDPREVFATRYGLFFVDHIVRITEPSLGKPQVHVPAAAVIRP